MKQHSSSFRDPAGFLFTDQGVLYRQINQLGEADYNLMITSGLYEELSSRGMLIQHEEIEDADLLREPGKKIIKPVRIPFVSYPYEWSFGELKEAALLTLKIQEAALDKGMSLKDASGYNIQFQGGKPVFIDTLSFECYRPGEPWQAYRQFCQHFLMPLALMSYGDVRCSQLLRIFIDGLPLDFGCSLLPLRARFRFGLLTHLFLHKSCQSLGAQGKPQTQKMGFSLHSFRALLDSLSSTVSSLKLRINKSVWDNYYAETNYTDDAMSAKLELVEQYGLPLKPELVWDLGGNTGRFSRIFSSQGISTVCFDFDSLCVEYNYRQVKKEKNTALLPLVSDLSNPSPALGWDNKERLSLTERGPADLVLALALVHHLAIANNVPLESVASYFAGFSKHLIIEFVPKGDSQVDRLLSTREDIFTDYDKESFEAAFSGYFEILSSKQLPGMERVVYLLKNKVLES